MIFILTPEFLVTFSFSCKKGEQGWCPHFIGEHRRWEGVMFRGSFPMGITGSLASEFL